MTKQKRNWGGKRTPAPGKSLGRPHNPKRSRSMLKMRMTRIEPDDNTMYLVGPEGLVWVQPAIGEPHIIAARNETEQQTAALFVGELLKMGLVPYGVPLNQRMNVAMFGGSPIRDCQWVKWDAAPAPVGEAGDTLPTVAGVVQ